MTLEELLQQPMDPNNERYNTDFLTFTYTSLTDFLDNTHWLACNNPLNTFDKTTLVRLFPDVNLELIFPGGEPSISLIPANVVNESLGQSRDSGNKPALLIQVLKRFIQPDQNGRNAKIEHWMIKENGQGVYGSYFTNIFGNLVDTSANLSIIPDKPITNQDIHYFDSTITYITDIISHYPEHFFKPNGDYAQYLPMVSAYNQLPL